MGFQFISSSPIEQHQFISGIGGTLSPQFRTLTENLIIPVSTLQRVVKNYYLTIRSSADGKQKTFMERIWETVSPKFRNPFEKNDEVVHYATAGMGSDLFVSKYEVVLPSTDELEKFVADEIRVLRETDGECQHI